MSAKVVRDTDANPAIILGVGQPHHVPVSLYVDANGGTVTIEIRNEAVADDQSAGAWVLPADPEHNITVDGDVSIDRVNRPSLRITATNGAVFTFYGDIR